MLLTSGTIMAHDSDFHITLTGRGGHGSAPVACIDPVVCGAALVTALQTIVSRSIPSAENAVVSVTMFHAGEATNVIPDKAELGGTIRDLNSETFKLVCAALERIVEGTAAAYGCEASVRYVGGYAETSNHVENTAIVERLAKKEPLAMDISADGLPLMGSEDFSYYLKKLPGCFFIVGTMEDKRQGLSALPFDGSKSKKSETTESVTAAVPGAGWANGAFSCASGKCVPGATNATTGDCCARSNCCPHGTAYDFNDNALPYVVAMFLKVVEDRLLVEGGEGFVKNFVDDGKVATVKE